MTSFTLSSPETDGETGSVHPKRSQKAALQHVKQKNSHFSVAFCDRFGWTDPVSPSVSGVGNLHLNLYDVIGDVTSTEKIGDNIFLKTIVFKVTKILERSPPPPPKRNRVK